MMVKYQNDTLHEKCAVVGVSTKTNTSEAAHIAYKALFALQHRGVEGSGIATTDGGVLSLVRRPGMVRDVFHQNDIDGLSGSVAVGHNRYSTNGNRHAHLQPVVNESIGFAFAHNGNIPDTAELEAYLHKRGYITEQYNDSELFGNAVASKLHGGRTFNDAIFEASAITTGAYACVATHGGDLVGFRDPKGIRPLEIGRFEGGMILASETCALDTIGAEHVRSVKPGEIVTVRNGEIVESYQFAEGNEQLDAFELVYFARHDSILLGQRVDSVRRRFGAELAKRHQPKADKNTTIVTAVPDTSVPAAESYAAELGLPYKTAIIKNRYIGRTFMQPTQASRQDTLRLKHTMIPELIAGKDVIMIDDSIVRGNTLPRLVALARELGANSVTILIASPPIRYPDFYGVDTPSQDDLMAATMTIEEMRQTIGADYLGFLSVSALVEAIGVPRTQLNLAAFTGEYPVSIGSKRATVRQPVSNEYAD
jgi:amidophosphoribosyltransferase